jgi:hypothetical protein
MVRDNGNCLLARSNYNWNLPNLGKTKKEKKKKRKKRKKEEI